MESPASNKKTIWKGQVGGSWHEREAIRLKRDGKLIAELNKWEVSTRTLGCALLGLPNTLQNRELVGRRYYQLSKSKCHYVRQGNQTYYVTINMTKSKAHHAQLEHLCMGAWRSSTLHQVIPPQKRITHDEIRNIDVPLFADEAYQYGIENGISRTTVLWEDETCNSDYYSIIPRCQTIFDQLGVFLGAFQTQKILVVWNFKDEEWSEAIARELRKFPEEMQNLFLICREKDIDPFNPSSAIGRIYIRTSTWTLHDLEVE